MYNDKSYNEKAYEKYTEFYYNFFLGEFPEDMNNYLRTKAFFEYLEECNISDSEIYMTIGLVEPKEFLSIDDIPSILREGSLLEPNKFYFHKELQVRSKPPTWDETFPYYLEMKIRYTAEDALDYFIQRSGVRRDWVNRDKEIGSIKYLLKEYKKFNFMEPIDFLLHLIDYCVSKEIELKTIYDLRDLEIDEAEYLESCITNAIAEGKNKIVWRDYLCQHGK